MASVFFSYSHKDEELRDRLEVALATLKRQGLIETWHDRMLRAGDEFDPGIRQELERADVILLLVSPDFIASNYCYDVEMTRALERHRTGEARVIPVILRACDWHPTPFGKLMAAPRDGKPIRSWPDLDEAFLDVAKKIRDALPKAPIAPVPANREHAPTVIQVAAAGPRSSNLRISKTFTEADQDHFLDEAFDFMAKFFEGSLSELKARNPEIDTTFKRIDANRFTAVIYRNGKAVSRCKIMLGGMLGRGISYSSNDQASDNSCNESLSIETDAQGMFLKPMMGMSRFGVGRERQHLTFEGAAEYYWDELMSNIQRD
ncbi:hypothetical protein DK26_06890 [Bosea sp. WAO]|uniref:toll/interleukin-1 receptor domain-containing protein n=1 Tax=Bosea sp. WAO TaxID=406341 RepID=UPI00074B12D0|nr:toll/interleukin-1 receptor domain-containing protein [Bosea sp. WAO]KUL96507.1 hypothetical protein DK26_06890 [Bosea sp. WAO]